MPLDVTTPAAEDSAKARLIRLRERRTMTSLKRFELWLSRTAFGVWMPKVFATRVDPLIFRQGGSRFISMGPIVIPQLVLTTRGRKSGQERGAQVAYTDLDGVVHVVASNFGGERHPAWYRAIRKRPVCEATKPSF
jgi:hypothetical protein